MGNVQAACVDDQAGAVGPRRFAGSSLSHSHRNTADGIQQHFETVPQSRSPQLRSPLAAPRTRHHSPAATHRDSPGRHRYVSASGHGSTERSLNLLAEEWVRCRTGLGDEHPDTLTAAHDLGLLYYDARELERAQLLVEWALDGREKTLGKEHLDTLVSMRAVGIVRGCKGEIEAAVAVLEPAVRGLQAQLGSDHPRTQSAQIWLQEMWDVHKSNQVLVSLESSDLDAVEVQSNKSRSIGHVEATSAEASPPANASSPSAAVADLLVHPEELSGRRLSTGGPRVDVDTPGQTKPNPTNHHDTATSSIIVSQFVPQAEAEEGGLSDQQEATSQPVDRGLGGTPPRTDDLALGVPTSGPDDSPQRLTLNAVLFPPADRAASNPLTLGVRLELAVQIVDGLAELHSAGSTYLALCPEHVIVKLPKQHNQRSGQPPPPWRASLATDATATARAEMAIYAAPEQILRAATSDTDTNEGAVGPAADVFSLGLVMWVLYHRQTLAGERHNVTCPVHV